MRKVKNAIFLFVSIMLMVFSFSSNAFAIDCSHSGDAGRWDDTLAPADRLSEMCLAGQTFYKANKGAMVISNWSPSACFPNDGFGAVENARRWQSWNQNWWLWNKIDCAFEANGRQQVMTVEIR